ncbi:MAG: hypothetical protein PUD59_05135 [bacterium]|nr:hypothetical protein [bacterium]
MEISNILINSSEIIGLVCEKKIKLNFNEKIICDLVKFKKKTVQQEIDFCCLRDKKNKENVRKSIFKMLKQFNLENLISRNIRSLSESEKFRLYFILQSSKSGKVFIYKNITKFLDLKNTKVVKSILVDMKKNDKTIIIIDNNVDIIFSLVDKIIYINDNVKLVYEDSKNNYSNIELLTRNNFIPPSIHMITYLAKKRKNVKLFYHKDARDIIKDIYKHV